MPSMWELIRSQFIATPVQAEIIVPDIKFAKARAPFASGYRASLGQQTARRSSAMLRHFADANVWLRVAINRRKQQISQASWHIARIDDREKPPDPAVVKAVGDLFRFCNPKRESLRSLLDQMLEDHLVLDAGVIEKEKTLGGAIAALYAVDGASISPDANWDGRNPKAIRYRQYVDDRLVAEWRNDEMLYVMANPRTTSAIGFSKVETLVMLLEAELYGEEYDYEMLKQTAPGGMIDLGGGIEDEKVDAFREYYETEIAGTRDMAIIGGGDGTRPAAVYTPFQRSSKEMQRREYMKWIATKIAAIFEMDLGVFNLTEAIHKSIGEKQERLTDQGHRSLGGLIEEFCTREIVWEFDPNHAFRIDGLNARDDAAQLALDTGYVSIGVWTPNQIRNRQGLDDVPWGDDPYVPNKGPVPPEPEPEATSPSHDTEANDDDESEDD